jgi:hypothetical protein
MINFMLQPFLQALITLREEVVYIQQLDANLPHGLMVGFQQERFREAFTKLIEPPLRGLDISPRRLRDIAAITQSGGRYSRLLHELKALDTDIFNAAKTEWFYHYRKDNAYLVIRVERVEDHWGKTLKEFKSAADDILRGVDCYAMEHYTASVFHFARVAEHGLRALAKERKVTLRNKVEYSEWGNVIEKLEGEIARIKKTPRGKDRDEALAFYTGAVAKLCHIKDKYRNVVMHARAAFGQSDARSAMNNTRELMESISEVMDEKGKKKKRWRL